MKNIKFIILLIAVSFYTSCVVEDGENPFYPPNEYGVFPIYNQDDIEFEATDDANDSTITFNITPSESGGASSTSGEVHISYEGSDFVKLRDITFPANLTVSLADAANTLNLDPSTLSTNGGLVNFKTYFTTDKGEIMTSTSYLTAVILCPPTPGDYTIDMADSYGDGWQTSTSSGGSGITITLDDGSIIEVGMCPAGGSGCTSGTSAAVATITIPTGTLSSEWYFPGDFYEEISFSIYSPAGNLIASFGTGTPEGVMLLNLCGE